MKIKTLTIAIALSLPLASVAEEFEVIPKVQKGDMKEIKAEFGKSVAESRKGRDQTDSTDAAKERKDNFGAKASAEARKLREQEDRKGGVGEFARSNNPGADKRPEDPGAAGRARSAEAREGAPGGRPSNVGGGMGGVRGNR